MVTDGKNRKNDLSNLYPEKKYRSIWLTGTGIIMNAMEAMHGREGSELKIETMKKNGKCEYDL